MSRMAVMNSPTAHIIIMCTRHAAQMTNPQTRGIASFWDENATNKVRTPAKPTSPPIIHETVAIAPIAVYLGGSGAAKPRGELTATAGVTGADAFGVTGSVRSDAGGTRQANPQAGHFSVLPESSSGTHISSLHRGQVNSIMGLPFRWPDHILAPSARKSRWSITPRESSRPARMRRFRDALEMAGLEPATC